MEYTVTHMILAENICSMSAREIMGAGMLRLNDAGFDIIMTVHDEAVMEVPLGWDADEHVLLVQRLMATRPAWCQDLPIAVEAFAAKRYCK